MRWVVVGAGSAGCVVAARLAEAGEQVLVVEAGGGIVPKPARGASFFDAVAVPGSTFPEPFLRGRGVGGSGVVNGMLATPPDGAQWRSWGWDDVTEAVGRVLLPRARPAHRELGPVDRALLASAPDAEVPLLTRRGRRRITAFDAYLAGRTDVALRADAIATKVVVESDRAVAVELAGGDVVEADAVVVSSGAIGSPLLLAASGVGGPGVGRHLRNHVALAVDLVLRDPTDPHGLVTGALLRRGDLQLVAVNHVGPEQPGRGGFLVVAMAATGDGQVSAGTSEQPDVELVVDDADRDRLGEGLVLVEQLLEHPSFQRLVVDVHVGQPPAGVYHATSTCRMGDVVDNDGAVVGCRNLFVVDASIFPELPSVNPYLSTLALAERMAPRLLRRRPA